ncbi:MAG: class A beta-lactamase-related serine hydrolase [Verrucomicrobiaceae bacterium]|nr:MAG: class A beta-lactamase-related serine hydrolase [Verrucomicrobiaceae bacterium]
MLMKNIFTVLCLSGFFFFPAQNASGQVLASVDPDEVGMSGNGLSRIDQVIQKYIDEKQLAGAVTIVARRGKVVQFKPYGMRDIATQSPMRKDTIFRIYSMTKAVVSVAAMILVEEGDLELDEPASKYVPALGRMKFKGKDPDREMSLRDLLRHTAGLPNNVNTDRALRRAGHPSLADSTLEEMMDRLDSVPLIYEPGKDWYYSFAADVVARLVEIGSKRRLDQALSELVFEPLGMVDTGFHVPKEKWDRFAVAYGNGLKPIIAPQPGTSGPFTFEKPPKFLSGGGGLVSTASDYMRFCLMLTGGGEFGEKRLLKKETVKMMLSDQLPEGVGEISRAPEGRGFGLGFAVRVRKTDRSPVGESEWLGGLGTEFFISPDHELAVITLSNQSPMRQIKSVVRPVVYDAIIEEKDQLGKVPDRDHYLVLDSRIIESKENAQLMPGKVKKSPDNPLFVEDKPWEPRYDNMYPNVIYDEEEKLYKCWYCPFIIDQRTSETPEGKRNPESVDYMNAKPAAREEAILYATSVDGIEWEKPDLGIFEFEGSRKNNIVCRGAGGSGVIKDQRDPDPDRRYKAFFCTDSGYRMRYSRDGIYWGPEVALPGVGESDTHANMIWSPELDRYVGILRHYDNVPVTGNRKIARTESADAVRWAKSKTILEGTPLDQLHDMVIFRDGGLYLGLIGCMNYPSAKSRDGVRQHIELAWSPDSYTWHRVSPGSPLIGHSPAKGVEYGKMPYDWGAMFPAAPVFVNNEIRIYYGASDWYFFDWRKGGLALATLGKDRWAGYVPQEMKRPAIVTTVPLSFKRKVLVTADVVGSIVVNIIGSDGETIAVSDPIIKDCTDHELSWDRDFELKKRERVRLRFKLNSATLYSFSFK